jgi:YegS/Rv2252/BmrU family lipid kinase
VTIDVRRARPTHPALLAGLTATLLVLLVGLGTLVVTGSSWLQDLDTRLSMRALVFTSTHDVARDAAHAISVGLDRWTWSPALLLVAIWLWRRGAHRVAAFVVAAGATEAVLNPLLKLLVDRDRPVHEEPLAVFHGLSFPSGHSSSAGVGCTVLVIVTLVALRRGRRRRLLITLLVVLALLVAASRVFYGAHYPSDVVAGLSEGVLVALLWWALLLRTDRTTTPLVAAVPSAEPRRAAVVLNPAKVGDVDTFKERVAEVARAAGWTEPMWLRTTVEDPGTGQAQAAIEAGVDLIVVAGGDGTVRTVCEQAAGSGVPVGIVPHGTGNLLARNLDVPLNIRDAMEVAFTGQDRAIDLGHFASDAPDAERTSFLVMAGLGMDAAIMTGVDEELKAKVGWAAYFVSGVKAARYPAQRVKITVDDDEPMKLKARTVVIGNVGFLQAGIPLLPAAQIDDGLLDAVVLAPKRFIGWLAIGARLFARGKRTNDRLERFTGTRILIEAKEPMPMQLDGDPVGEGTRIEATVSAGVLLVRVPDDAALRD